MPLLLAALLAALLGLLIVIRTLIASRSVINYTDPDWPSFEGSYAPKQPTFDGTLKAVTWNIAFAEKTEQAIAELSEMDRSRSADVLMLQEMDEEGTDQIARALGYNYVYYPASIHSHHDR
ncbi:MAG: endonuclease/exonuclease/phosphatase family protein, partial [Candidatus Promineifilaceae bacterium]